MNEPNDELVRLRELLAEEHQRNERLENRVAELIHERSQLYNELHVYRAHQKASDLTDELTRLGFLNPDDETQ